jgi:hypothetical protein
MVRSLPLQLLTHRQEQQDLQMPHRAYAQQLQPLPSPLQRGIEGVDEFFVDPVRNVAG